MLDLILLLSFANAPAPVPVQRPAGLASAPDPARSAPGPVPEGPPPPPDPRSESNLHPDPESVRSVSPQTSVSDPEIEPPPSAPEPAPVPEPTVQPLGAGGDDLAAREPMLAPAGARPPADYVRVRPPAVHGTGMIVVGTAAMGASVLMQSIWAGICGDPFCEMAGIHQRALIGSGIVFISAGAYKRGQWNAYRDTLAGSPMPGTRLRAHEIAGFTVGVAGLIAFATDFAFHSQCAIAQRGPNVVSLPEQAWTGVDCKGWASAAVMNLSGAAAATGFGLGFHALKYERDRRYYRRAFVAAAPSFGRDHVGVAVSGSF